MTAAQRRRARGADGSVIGESSVSHQRFTIGIGVGIEDARGIARRYNAMMHCRALLLPMCLEALTRE
jgi:hypothetical protein